MRTTTKRLPFVCFARRYIIACISLYKSIAFQWFVFRLINTYLLHAYCEISIAAQSTFPVLVVPYIAV